jgi:hypothetical protein
MLNHRMLDHLQSDCPALVGLIFVFPITVQVEGDVKAVFTNRGIETAVATAAHDELGRARHLWSMSQQLGQRLNKRFILCKPIL